MKSPNSSSAVLHKHKPLTTLHLVQAFIRNQGFESAWKNIGDLAAYNDSHTTGHSNEPCELRIYDFFRPEHYKNPSDLLVRIGNAVVPLFEVGQCTIGRTLLQSIFSEVDDLGRRNRIITEEQIRKDVIEWSKQQASTIPYLLAESELHYYLRWKCSTHWERYEKLKLLGTYIGRVLESLPSAEKKWIKEVTEPYPFRRSEPKIEASYVSTGHDSTLEMAGRRSQCWRPTSPLPPVVSNSYCKHSSAYGHEQPRETRSKRLLRKLAACSPRQSEVVDRKER